MRLDAISLSLSSHSSSNISLGSTLKSAPQREPCSPRDSDRLQLSSILPGFVSIKEECDEGCDNEERDASEAVESKTEQQDLLADHSGLSPRKLFLNIPLARKKGQQSEKKAISSPGGHSQQEASNDHSDPSPSTNYPVDDVRDAVEEGELRKGVASPASTKKKLLWKSRDKTSHETTASRQAQWLEAVKAAIQEKNNSSVKSKPCVALDTVDKDAGSTCFGGAAVAALTSRAYQHATNIFKTPCQLATTSTTQNTHDTEESVPATGDEDERNYDGDDDSVASVASIELLCNWLTCREEISGPEIRGKKGQETREAVSRRKSGHRGVQVSGLDSPVAGSNKLNRSRMGRLSGPWSPRRDVVVAPDELQRKISLQKKLAKSETARQARLAKSLGLVEL